MELQTLIDNLKHPLSEDKCLEIIEFLPEIYKRHFYTRMKLAESPSELKQIIKNLETAIKTESL